MKAILRCHAVMAAVVTLAGCATSNLGALSGAERKAVKRVEVALNRQEMMRGVFTQVGPGRQQGWGHYQYRPGYLHLTYDVPRGLDAEAKSGHLVVTDQASGAVTRIGLARNPLGLLLRQPLQIDRKIEVTQVQQTADSLRISLAEAANPSQGLLTLDFFQNNGALVLMDLIGTDAHQQRIKLILHHD